MNNSKWMTDLYNSKGDYKLTDITLPGSHDSGSYQLLDCWSGIIPIKNWTLTQNMNIADQLELGIRVFDLRVCFLNGNFYISHTFKCELLQVVLTDFINFMASNSTEIVIILIKPDYNLAGTINPDLLYQYIKGNFTKGNNNAISALNYYNNRTDFYNVLSNSYSNLLKMNINLLFVYNFETLWLNKATLSDFVLTPSSDSVSKNLCSSIQKLNNGLIDNNFELVLSKPYLAIDGDFVNADFVNKIIQYNKTKLGNRPVVSNQFKMYL